MLMAHKIALDPNNVQATYFARAAGTAHFADNWALAEWQRPYDAWKQDNSLPKPSQQSLRRQLDAIGREQFPWMLDVTKNAPQMAIRKKGIPDRFTLTHDQFSAEGCRIRIHLNAARNLATYTASSAVSACGEDGAGSGRKTGTTPAPPQ